MDIAKIRKKGKDAIIIADQSGLPDLPDLKEPAAKEVPALEHPEHRKEEGGAGAKPAADAGEVTMELLTFSLAQEEYAFRIHDIEEIQKILGFTRIPKSESYVLGVTSLRGKIIPIIDLKRRLCLSGGTANNKKQRILILKGPKGPIGALIDRVVGVIRPRVSKIGEIPPHLLETEMKFLEGVALVDGRFISIVKVEEAMNIA